jgi:hypothetical protein
MRSMRARSSANSARSVVSSAAETRSTNQDASEPLTRPTRPIAANMRNAAMALPSTVWGTMSP